MVLEFLMAILNTCIYGEVPFNPVCGHFCNQSFQSVDTFVTSLVINLQDFSSSSEPPVIYRLYPK